MKAVLCIMVLLSVVGCSLQMPTDSEKILQLLSKITNEKKRENVNRALETPCADQGNEGSGNFQCGDGNGCVWRVYRCDGKVDCEDKSDEDEAYCSAYECSAYRTKCADGLQCIRNVYFCEISGETDCNDKSDEDEDFCRQWDCTDSAIKCDNGVECVYKGYVCDGEDDCTDGSDEQNCPDLESGDACSGSPCTTANTVGWPDGDECYCDCADGYTWNEQYKTCDVKTVSKRDFLKGDKERELLEKLLKLV